MVSSPRLCVDVSNTLETASLSGIQRVTLELVSALRPLATVMPLDGRSAQFSELRGPQLRRLEKLRAGRGKRGIGQRLESRAVRAAPVNGSPITLQPNDLLLDIEASWHAPMARSELLPDLGARSAALIHDVLPLTNPSWFPAESVARFQSWFDAHVAAESTLLAVSNATADAVVTLGARRPTVIRMGQAAAPTTSHGNGILMIGTIEPRKGHATMLDALDLLGDQAPVVDVVGKPGWDTDQLAERMLHHSCVRWHRDVDDETLEQLWSLSGLLLQPSLGEGFGLPVVEALQRGVAVASSDIEVMREVGRGRTTLLPQSPERWAETIATFSADPSAWERPAPLPWPTWADSAHDVLEALIADAAWPDAAAASQ